MKVLSRIGFLLILSLLFTGCGYNSLQMKEEQVFKAWADVEATLQRLRSMEAAS